MSYEDKIKNIIEKAYAPCRKCHCLDPILQDELTEQRKAEYNENLKMLKDNFFIGENEYDMLVRKCDKCLEERIHLSEIIKANRPNFEKIGIKDPFK